MGVGVDFLFHFVYYSNHDVNEQKSPRKAVKVRPIGFALSAQKADFYFEDITCPKCYA